MFQTQFQVQSIGDTSARADVPAAHRGQLPGGTERVNSVQSTAQLRSGARRRHTGSQNQAKFEADAEQDSNVASTAAATEADYQVASIRGEHSSGCRGRLPRRESGPAAEIEFEGIRVCEHPGRTSTHAAQGRDASARERAAWVRVGLRRRPPHKVVGSSDFAIA